MLSFANTSVMETVITSISVSGNPSATFLCVLEIPLSTTEHNLSHTWTMLLMRLKTFNS